LTKLFTALGLMSGTSMDGIDVALVRSDGEAVVHRGPFLGVPYDEATRARLREALEDAASLRRHTDRPGRLAEVERRLTRLHADAVSAFLVACDLNIADLDVIGFHGQTVLHRPQARLTVQLGDGAALARATGVPVVCDLRQADIAAGGQGAPLVPVYHQALAAGLPERPVAFVNIGGVANVTLVGAGVPIAFDCGPGNALLDDWAMRHTGTPIDRDGALAAHGTPDAQVLARLLAHPFFTAAWPKSLDRSAFSLDAVAGLSPQDGAATLAQFTVEAIAAARDLLPERPARWIVCGGGRRNRVLLAALAARMDAPVEAAEAAGFDGDAMEAEAWGYLAIRSLRGLPVTFPTTTGCPSPMTGGVLHRL
jgi:anhydro-N-acetylmuramic acid kinase